MKADSEGRKKSDVVKELTQISDIDTKKAERLYKLGCESLDDIVDQELEKLKDAYQLNEEDAVRILKEAKELKEQLSDEKKGSGVQSEKLLGGLDKIKQSLAESEIDEDIKELEEVVDTVQISLTHLVPNLWF